MTCFRVSQGSRPGKRVPRRVGVEARLFRRPAIVIGQHLQHFNELGQGLRACRHRLAGFIDDGLETPLAAQLKDALKVGICEFAPVIGPFQPNLK